MSRDDFNYDSLRRRSKIAIAAFGLIAFVDTVAVVSGLLEVSLLQRVMDGETISMQEADVNDSRQAVVGLVQLVLFITATVSFLMWFHRAHKNLEAIEMPGLKYSARWAVGSFFVPFLNLFRPFQIARETWLASAAGDAEGANWRKARTPALLKWWWGLFLIESILAGRGARAYAAAGDQLETLILGSSLMLASDVLAVPAALLAMLLVRRVTQNQRSMPATPRVPAEAGI